MPSRATRDRGLQRIATSTRFLAVGALVAGGVLTAVVAKAIPGKSGPSAPAGTTTPTSTAGGGQATNVTPLTSPAQAPQPVTAPPVASSGGS